MKHDWFYMKGAEKHGPVSSSKLRELAQSGQLLPTDLVWREGMSDWKRARKVAGLFDGKSAPERIEPPAAPPAANLQLKRPPPPPGNLLGNAGSLVRPVTPTGSLSSKTAAPKRPSTPPSNLLGNTNIQSPPRVAAATPAWTTAPTANPWPAPPPTAHNPPPTAGPAGAGGIFRCPHCRQEMSDDPSVAGEMVRCPHCAKEFTMPASGQAGRLAAPVMPLIITTSPARATTSGKRTASRRRKPSPKSLKVPKATIPGLGCLCIFLCCGGALMLIGSVAGVPGLEVAGDSATLTYKIDHDMELDLSEYQLAWYIHEAAHKHPEVKTIALRIKLHVSSTVDHFGNSRPLDETYDAAVLDADEIRQYKTEVAYNRANGATLGGYILRLAGKYPQIFPKMISGLPH